MATIRKRGNRYQIDYYDPSGRRVRKTFKKKKDAEAELGKRVSLIAEGRYLDVKKECTTTLGQLIEKYRKAYGHQSSYKISKKAYLTNIENHFGPESLLDNIRYMHLETYRNDLFKKVVKATGKKAKIVKVRKPATINREVSCLHHLFSKAVEWEMIERNPFDSGKSLVLKENNQRVRFLQEDEIKNLLKECPEYLRRVVVCALNTGMRRGEILSLKWDQIRNGFVYLEKTKTNERREIPVNDTLEKLFAEIRKDDGLRYPYVFTFRGRKINTAAVAFNNAVRRAGITDFTFHDLRHTFASQLVMSGASLKDVQELLGHKTLTMTLRYAHLTQESKKKAVNLLNGLTTSEPTGHKTVTVSFKPKATAV